MNVFPSPPGDVRYVFPYGYYTSPWGHAVPRGLQGGRKLRSLSLNLIKLHLLNYNVYTRRV